MFVKDDDKFTLHRHPVAQSTDCMRGKQGYTRGIHAWEFTWYVARLVTSLPITQMHSSGQHVNAAHMPLSASAPATRHCIKSATARWSVTTSTRGAGISDAIDSRTMENKWHSMLTTNRHCLCRRRPFPDRYVHGSLFAYISHSLCMRDVVFVLVHGLQSGEMSDFTIASYLF